MILEREDWEEPGCCFRPDTAAHEVHPRGRTLSDHGSDREYDRLIAMDAAKEAGEHLERCLKQFEAAGDWAPRSRS